MPVEAAADKEPVAVDSQKDDVHDDDSSTVDTEEESDSSKAPHIAPRPQIDRPQEPVLRGDNRADALAVAQHFVEFFPYMLKTADVSYWGEHADASCDTCVKILAAVERMKISGEWVDGTMSVDDVLIEDPGPGSDTYQVHFLVTRRDVLEHRDDELTYSTDKTYYINVQVSLRNSVWKVLEFRSSNPDKFTEIKNQLDD